MVNQSEKKNKKQRKKDSAWLLCLKCSFNTSLIWETWPSPFFFSNYLCCCFCWRSLVHCVFSYLSPCARSSSSATLLLITFPPQWRIPAREVPNRPATATTEGVSSIKRKMDPEPAQQREVWWRWRWRAHLLHQGETYSVSHGATKCHLLSFSNQRKGTRPLLLL